MVCLLLLICLVRQYRKGLGRKQVIRDSARSVSLAEHLLKPIPQRREPRPIVAPVNSRAPTKSRPAPQARAARHPLEPEQASATLLIDFPAAAPQAAAPPQPKKITLEPLGYAQKADGRVEAIISQGEQVQVVHEGEIVEGSFRVAKISASAVELVENSGPPSGSGLTPESGQSVAQALAVKSPQMPPRPNADLISNAGANHPFAADSLAPALPPPVGQALGYVEKADGRVEAIVADGEHVQLTPASKSFATNFHVPEPSEADLTAENAEASANPADSVAFQPQPVQPGSLPQEVGQPPLVASRSAASTSPEAQGVLQNQGGAQSPPLGVVQPEPLADYAGSMLETREAASGLPAGVAVGAPSPGIPSAGQALRDGAKPSPPSGGRRTQSALMTLGYVEKAGGEKEAIVEFLGQVYLLHEGDLFAERYRVLQVSPSSVRIVEESAEKPSSSSK